MHHGIEAPFEGHDVWKGVVAGAIAGLAAAWVMNMFQAGSQRLQQKFQPEQQQSSSESGGDDATVKTAKAIAEPLGHQLTDSEKKVAGPLVHYAFGTAMGALYGLVSEIQPNARLGFGTLFGTALWLTADEIMVPALKLGPKPNETPLKSHANALAAHLVYGAAAESIRLGVRAAIDHHWHDTAEDVDEYMRDSWPVKYVLQRAA
jgi:hypothetical protein